MTGMKSGPSWRIWSQNRRKFLLRGNLQLSIPKQWRRRMSEFTSQASAASSLSAGLIERRLSTHPRHRQAPRPICAVCRSGCAPAVARAAVLRTVGPREWGKSLLGGRFRQLRLTYCGVRVQWPSRLRSTRRLLANLLARVSGRSTSEGRRL